MTPALSVRGVGVTVGGRRVLDDVSIDIAAGSVVGLIGPNGAGKTTLLDAVTGFVAASGDVLLSGRSVRGLPPHARARRGLSRTFQGLELFEDLDVADNLRVAAESARGMRGESDGVPGLLDRLGLAPTAARLPRVLSHAQRSTVALGRALAGRPEVLLLDEPAAGLDAVARSELGRLVRELAAAGTAVLLVDHDADLVLQTCDVVHVLHTGRLLTGGPPDAVRDDPRVQQAYLGEDAHPARRAPGGPPAAPPVVVVEGLHAGYGDVPVLHGVDLHAAPGEVVAVLGRNGAGKSTLLRSVAGVHRPTAGRVEVLGEPPRDPTRAARRGVTFLPQSRGLFLRLTARENLRLAPVRRPLDDVLARLPDLAPVLDRPVAELSGGEQQQLALARALLTDPRVLLVDELSLGLAPQAVDALVPLLREIADHAGTAVLLVEQHAALALAVADRAYVLDRGHVTLAGAAADLAGDPQRLRDSYLGPAPG